MAAAAQLLDRVGRQPAFDHHHAGTRLARPERRSKVLGVPGRRVDRLLDVHAAMDMEPEELRGTLVLLVAAGRAPGEIGLAIAQRQRGRERGARALARRKRIGMALLEPELLRTCAQTETKLG